MAGKTKIAEFLKTRKSNQGEAASVIGVSQSTFSVKANGFSAKEIEKLAKHYDMSEAEIKNVFYG